MRRACLLPPAAHRAVLARWPGGLCDGAHQRRAEGVGGKAPHRAPPLLAMPQLPVKIGAVAYDPKVVEIWEGIRDYFRGEDIPTDYVLFSNYEALVDALLDRRVDMAWNTNVAFVRAERRAGGRCLSLAMRNTDREFTTRLIAP